MTDIKNTDEKNYKNPDGSIEDHKDLFLDFEKKIYSIDAEDYKLINNKFVHLSANYNEPFSSLIDHKQLAYTNTPQFNKNEQEISLHPYQRLSYTPVLSKQDKINSY